MSSRNPEFDAWRAEIRGIRTAVRDLAAPNDDSMGLSSPGEELLGFLLDSPADLPMVTFSPFAGLPGGAVSAPARRTEGPIHKAGRAPGVPPVPPRGEPPAALRPTAAPPRSRPVITRETISTETGPAQPAQTAPPVFSFRRQGGKADPVPSAPAAPGIVQGAHPGAPSSKRGLSLSDLLSLKSQDVWPEEQGIAERAVPEAPGPLAAAKAGQTVSPVPAAEALDARALPDPAGLASVAESPREAVAPGSAAVGGSSRHDGDLPPVLPARRALESPLTAGSGGSDPFENYLAEGTGRPLELLNDLAERALRRQDGTALDLGASVPDRAGLPTLESSTSPSRTTALATDGEGKARFPGPEMGRPEPEPAPALPESGGPPHLDAETLADLINEALVEQARRHGVDLS